MSLKGLKSRCQQSWFLLQSQRENLFLVSSGSGGSTLLAPVTSLCSLLLLPRRLSLFWPSYFCFIKIILRTQLDNPGCYLNLKIINNHRCRVPLVIHSNIHRFQVSWIFLEDLYSAYHSLPSDPERFTSILHPSSSSLSSCWHCHEKKCIHHSNSSGPTR